MHMGIDTVELNGTPFTVTCKVGDHVKQGQKIGEVNWKAIAKAKKDTVVPIIWTNGENKAVNIINDNGRSGVRIKGNNIFVYKQDVKASKACDNIFMISDGRLTITIIVNEL